MRSSPTAASAAVHPALALEPADRHPLGRTDQPVAGGHRGAVAEQRRVAHDDRAAVAVADDHVELAAGRPAEERGRRRRRPPRALRSAPWPPSVRSPACSRSRGGRGGSSPPRSRCSSSSSPRGRRRRRRRRSPSRRTCAGSARGRRRVRRAGHHDRRRPRHVRGERGALGRRGRRRHDRRPVPDAVQRPRARGGRRLPRAVGRRPPAPARSASPRSFVDTAEIDACGSRGTRNADGSADRHRRVRRCGRHGRQRTGRWTAVVVVAGLLVLLVAPRPLPRPPLPLPQDRPPVSRASR